MTNRDVAMLAFKLFALWLMANTAIAVAGLPLYWQPEYYDETRRTIVFFTLLPVLVSIGIAIPVWFSADWFAARIFPGQSHAPMRFDRLRGEAVVALACSVIGILFVAESLPTFVHAISLFAQSRSATSSFLGPDVDQQRELWSAAARANVTAGIARFFIGLTLLAGPASLGRAVGRLRKELTGNLETVRATASGRRARRLDRRHSAVPERVDF